MSSVLSPSATHHEGSGKEMKRERDREKASERECSGIHPARI